MSEAAAQLSQTEEWKYDADTWTAMTSQEFDDCTLTFDPTDWGITVEDIAPTFYGGSVARRKSIKDPVERETFSLRCHDLYHRRDGQGMGTMVGKEWLFALSRRKSNPNKLEPALSDGGPATMEDFKRIMGITFLAHK